MRVLATLMVVAATSAALADEGMWLFNRPPVELLERKHGFAPDAHWLEHLQKSCVRFSTGGSGSIVSASGLVMTNHHVGSDMLEYLSTPERNLLETGFLARTRDEELTCPGLELLALWSIEDVTRRIQTAAEGALASGGSVADAEAARRKASASLESEEEAASGLDCKVITLYQGGEFHLYRYRRFTEIKLVMAPEQAIAFFGGDTDNFEYPRYDLDICFFRIYEGGKPLAAEHWLHWGKSGARERDLVFVAGNPGSTDRLDTVEDLKFQRDLLYPSLMRRLWRREVQLDTFSARSREHARIASGDYYGVQNSRKANTGTLAGLLEPGLMAHRIEEERALRARVASNPEHQKRWGDGWDLVHAAVKVQREILPRNSVMNGLNDCQLFRIAFHLVRLADELPKPNTERLEEYRDSELDAVKLRLFNPAPIYPLLEVDRLRSALSWIAESFGAEDPVAALALGGASPQARAQALVGETKLADVAERQRYFDGGRKTIDASTDPMIRLALALDPESRARRKRLDDEVEAREKEGYGKIAAAQFAILGGSTYPDATFTLRLSFGIVKGYREDGLEVPPFTDYAGLYRRAEERAGEPTFSLPRVWVEKRAALDPSVPLDFVHTCDIIGGNSGSPTVNRAGEIVGIVFDGNLQSLAFDIGYSEEQARAISVDSRGILEALEKVYGAKELAGEILGR